MKPEFGQRRENDSEISSVVAGKESRYVLDEKPPACSEKSVGDSCEFEEEAGSLPGEPAAASGDAEVLAGESAGEAVDGAVVAKTAGRVLSWPFKVGAVCDSRQTSASSLDSARCDFSYVLVDRDVGEAVGEDPSPPSDLLALEDDFVSCSLKAEVDSADAREE